MSDPAREHEAFLRWQDIRRTQFTYTVNLVLTLTTATLAFAINLIVEQKIKPTSPGKDALSYSLGFLLVAVAAGLACNLSRLFDFRYSAKAARSREMEARRVAGETLTDAEKVQAKDGSRHSKLADCLGISTWCLLVAQLTAFFVGVLLLSDSVRQTYWAG